MRKSVHLRRAGDIWQESSLQTPKERQAHIPELRDMQLFSNRQIAKISRTGPTTVNRVVINRSGGGRLNPESLTAIAFLMELKEVGDSLPFYVIRTIVAEGTSLSYLCKVLGVSPVAMYRKLKGE